MNIVKILPKNFDPIIFDYWISYKTFDEILLLSNRERTYIESQIALFNNLNMYPQEVINYALFTKSDTKDKSENEFSYPIFNVWHFDERQSEESYYEKRILTNLLYLYSKPLDTIIDPFAGKGSTIDICKNRLRRYWVSDRKPYGSKKNHIRKFDILKDTPQIYNWNSVSVTFLDPPYWVQARGKYSNDPEDLGNMSLEYFTNSIVEIVNKFAGLQKRGIIALTMRATQESVTNDYYVDHTMQIINKIKNPKLKLENRVSCPYSVSRYDSDRIEWATQNRKLFVNNREVIIWKVD